MFTSKEQEIISAMASISQEFRDTGIYTPALLKRGCDSVGIAHSWTLLKKSTKPAHGKYKVEFTEELTVAEKKTRPAKAAPVAEQPALVAKTETVDLTQKSITRSVSGAVPTVDKNYVPFGNYKDIEKIIKSRSFFPILITGESGNGKSSSILQIHARNNLPLIRLNMTKKTDADELIGSKTLIDGNVYLVEGPIITAMRQGCTVLIDEIDAGDANTLLCLQIILEGKPYYFSALGEYVHPAPGFNVIMTANTKGQGSESGRYFGTNILNEAFMERIALTFEQEFPSAAIEKKIIVNMMNSYGCVDEGFAEELVKWADAIRRSFADGAVDSVISTRRLEHIVRGFSIFEDKKKVVQYAVNRFDTMTKQAFFDLFDKISVDPTTKATSTEATETPVAA